MSKTPPGTQLLQAAQNGELKTVRRLIEGSWLRRRHKADIDTRSTTGHTALTLAARRGHLEVVRYLLQQGAAKEDATGQGANALVEAAKSGHIPVIEQLIDAGAQLEAHTPGEPVYDTTPLGWAVVQVQEDAVGTLLAAGANPSAEFVATGLRRTVGSVLQHALDRLTFESTEEEQAASQRILEMLLDVGADPNVVESPDGGRPLHTAIRCGPAVLRALLEHGADPHTDGDEGKQALETADACRRRDDSFPYDEVVAVLRQAGCRGADTRTKDGPTKAEISSPPAHEGPARVETEAHSAARRGELGTLERLAAAEPALFSSVDELGRTPAHICAVKDDPGGARVAVRAAPDCLRAYDKSGFTPTHRAILANARSVLEALVALDESAAKAWTLWTPTALRGRGRKGVSPADLAAGFGRGPCLSVLRRRGLEPTERVAAVRADSEILRVPRVRITSLDRHDCESEPEPAEEVRARVAVYLGYPDLPIDEGSS